MEFEGFNQTGQYKRSYFMDLRLDDKWEDFLHVLPAIHLNHYTVSGSQQCCMTQADHNVKSGFGIRVHT